MSDTSEDVVEKMLLARRTMTTRGVLAAALVGACAAPAFAVEHVWLDSGGYSGTFNTATHWDNNNDSTPGDGIPGSSDRVRFNNAQATPYTVSFSANASTQQFHVVNDKVIFDLNGRSWTGSIPDPAPFPSTEYAFDISGTVNPESAWLVGGHAGASAAVTFSSSAAGGTLNTLLSPTTYRSVVIGNTTAGTGSSVTLNNSLGNGITWLHRGNLILNSNSSLNVDEGSTFTSDYAVFYQIGNYGSSTAAINVRNGGQFIHTAGTYQFAIGNGDDIPTITVETGGLMDLPLSNPNVGFLNPGYVTVQSGGTFNAQDAQVGLYDFYTGAGRPTINATLSVDGATSSANLRNLTLGSAADLGANDTGVAVVKNGALMTVDDTVTINERIANNAASPKNTLSLDNGTVQLGDSTHGGVITSRGIVRGVGTIERGTGNTGSLLITLNADSELRAGDTSATPAIGQLTVDGGNVNQASGTAYFNFTGGSLSDRVDVTTGTATLSGALDYSILGGYVPTQNDGNVFDFVIADTITYAPTSDNMASLLLSHGLTPGMYFYGVVNEGGNDVLRLALVPEPGAAFLLAMCGGVGMLRRRRR